MSKHRDEIVVVIAWAAACVFAFGRQTWSQDRQPESKSSVEVSLVAAESWIGCVPLKALRPLGSVKDMMSLVEAPSVPGDVLNGKVTFNEDGVGMVVLPTTYVAIVAELAISVQSKTTIMSSELTIVDAQSKTHHGTLWENGLHAWVCSKAQYEPGRYEEYIIFILPLSVSEGDMELRFRGQKLASLSNVTKRSALPEVSAKALSGRIAKESDLGRGVLFRDGQLIDVGSSLLVSGTRWTTVEPVTMYSNEEFGLSFAVPKGPKVYTPDKPGPFALGPLIIYIENPDYKDVEVINVRRTVDRTEFDLYQFKDRLDTELPPVREYRKISLKFIHIGTKRDKLALEYVYEYNDRVPRTLRKVAFIHNGQGFDFDCMTNQERYKQTNKWLFDPIFSGMKFK